MKKLTVAFRNFTNGPKNVSDKSFRVNTNTHFMCNILDFSLEKTCLFEIRWKNIVQPCRQRIKIWLMRIACWIPEATNAHTGSLTLIAFPLQQWLHERGSILCYTYIASLVL